MATFSPYTNDQTLLPKTGGAITGAVTMTVDNNDNYVPLTITQNDTTNNPNAVNITNAGMGHSIYISTSCNNTDSDIYINSTATTGFIFEADMNSLTNGRGIFGYCNSANLSVGSVFYSHIDHVSATGNCYKALNDGTGNGILVDQNGNGLAINIDKDCTVNDTRTWAVAIASDNAGTGTALGCGIDMSSFSVDEPLFKVVADAGNTPGTLTGQIAIDVAGTTYYVYYYTTSTVV